MKSPTPQDVVLLLDGNTVEVIQIWEDEKARVAFRNGTLKIKDLRYGMLFKIEK